MNLLAIDSLSPYQGVALLRDGSELAFESAPNRTKGALMRKKEPLLPLLDTVISRAGVALKDLDAAAITIGPGSYTGMRVSIATLQGMLFGTGIGVIPVCMLHCLEQYSRDSLSEERIGVIRMRKTEWVIRTNNQLVSLDEEGIKNEISGLKVLTMGAVPEGCGDVIELDDTMVRQVSSIGLKRWDAGEITALEELRPVYCGDYYG